MKTIEERFEDIYGTKDQYKDSTPQWSDIALYVARKDSFETGATEQKAIMLEEASRGFEEWFLDCGYYPDNYDQCKDAYQASTLSKMEEIEELKTEKYNLIGEVRELKKDLERALNMGEFYKEERWVEQIRKKHNLESR